MNRWGSAGNIRGSLQEKKFKDTCLQVEWRMCSGAYCCGTGMGGHLCRGGKVTVTWDDGDGGGCNSRHWRNITKVLCLAPRMVVLTFTVMRREDWSSWRLSVPVSCLASSLVILEGWHFSHGDSGKDTKTFIIFLVGQIAHKTNKRPIRVIYAFSVVQEQCNLIMSGESNLARWSETQKTSFWLRKAMIPPGIVFGTITDGYNVKKGLEFYCQGNNRVKCSGASASCPASGWLLIPYTEECSSRASTGPSFAGYGRKISTISLVFTVKKKG